MPTSTSIPFIYRFTFLYFEPLAALSGSLLNLLYPQLYLQSFIPPTTSPTPTPTPTTVLLQTQLAALLLFFAWSQAIVLRSTTDIRVWKAVLFGMFLCDVLHLFASWRVLGGEVFWDMRRWRVEEWVNFGMLYGPGGLRLAFCAGVGLGGGRGEEEKKDVKRG